MDSFVHINGRVLFCYGRNTRASLVVQLEGVGIGESMGNSREPFVTIDNDRGPDFLPHRQWLGRLSSP